MLEFIARIQQNEVFWNIAVDGIGCLGGPEWIWRRGDLGFPCKFNVVCCVLPHPSLCLPAAFPCVFASFLLGQGLLLPGIIPSASSHWGLLWSGGGGEAELL